jgi:hypothetical protein
MTTACQPAYSAVVIGIELTRGSIFTDSMRPRIPEHVLARPSLQTAELVACGARVIVGG